MVAYGWQPIEGLDSQFSPVDFQEIDSLHHQWVNFVNNVRNQIPTLINRSWSVLNAAGPLKPG